MERILLKNKFIAMILFSYCRSEKNIIHFTFLCNITIFYAKHLYKMHFKIERSSLISNYINDISDISKLAKDNSSIPRFSKRPFAQFNIYLILSGA
jgi:hypothetical protein